MAETWKLQKMMKMEFRAKNYNDKINISKEIEFFLSLIIYITAITPPKRINNQTSKENCIKHYVKGNC